MSLTAESGLPAVASGQALPGAAPFLLCASRDVGAEDLIEALRTYGIPVSGDLVSAAKVGSGASGAELARDLAELLGAVDGAPAIGAALRWDDFAQLIVHPSVAEKSAEPPGSGFHWHTLIERALPGLRYVHVLRREKAVASEDTGTKPVGESQAADLDTTSRAEDWSWIGFFTWARIQPLTIAHEEFVTDPSGTLNTVLRFLDVTAPALESASVAGNGRPVPARSKVRARNGQNVARRGPAPPVSIVVVSHNEGEKLPLTVSGIRATVPDDVEIVVVDDWSTDQSTRSLYSGAARVIRPPSRSGVAGARNWGASQARGNLLVFADAHVDPSDGWLEALRAAFADPSVACAAPAITAIGRPGSLGHGCTWAKPQLGMKWLRTSATLAHEVPFICGCLMAFRRDDFETIGGFDTGMVCWGSEDAEICLNLWRRGRSTVVVPQARVAHLFRPSGPYPVEPHLVVHNALRMATVHLPELAVRRVIQVFSGLPSFPLAYTQLVDSDVWKRRESIAAQSLHDGAWFLDRFRIEALR
jgi:GT2 family glycosyltransferase